MKLPHDSFPNECDEIIEAFPGPHVDPQERTPAEWLATPLYTGIEIAPEDRRDFGSKEVWQRPMTEREFMLRLAHTNIRLPTDHHLRID